eukprot:9214602-Lingulodinium_polyedra.AAC.1
MVCPGGKGQGVSVLGPVAFEQQAGSMEPQGLASKTCLLTLGLPSSTVMLADRMLPRCQRLQPPCQVMQCSVHTAPPFAAATALRSFAQHEDKVPVVNGQVYQPHAQTGVALGENHPVN